MTHERLLELLYYEPETGKFHWRVTRSNRAVAGSSAGTNSYGYLVIRLDNVLYQAHRLAWLYVHGQWPKCQIDHINGIRNDNRIANLREATNAENRQNAAVQSNNTSSYSGISWHIRVKAWQVYIKVDSRNIYIGKFTDIKDAVEARKAAKREYHTFNPEDRELKYG